MIEPYIVKYRTEFLPWRGGRYARQGWEYCLGTRKDASVFIEAGAVCLPWGEAPGAADLKKMRALRLLPNARQLREASLPAWIAKAPSLEFLQVPVSFPPSFEKGNPPDSLTSLLLVNSAGTQEILQAGKAGWPDVILTRLRALQFIDAGASKPTESLLGVGPHLLPALKLLECSIRNAQAKLEEIAGFRGLEFLALEQVEDADVFEFINSPLQAFSIVGAGRKFPIDNIARLKTVELLWLNNLKCELDMEIFATLPRLREINVLNCSKIKSPQALLAGKKLESIQFMRCGKPFTPDIKAALAAKGYQRLEIALA